MKSENCGRPRPINPEPRLFQLVYSGLPKSWPFFKHRLKIKSAVRLPQQPMALKSQKHHAFAIWALERAAVRPANGPGLGVQGEGAKCGSKGPAKKGPRM